MNKFINPDGKEWTKQEISIISKACKFFNINKTATLARPIDAWNTLIAYCDQVIGWNESGLFPEDYKYKKV